MVKKIIFTIITLCFIVGGFFYWQQNQADVKKLNENLPDGVKIVKSLIGEKYKVLNKIDGYEFKIPPEWKGIKEIEYFPQETERGYTGSSIGLRGNLGEGRVMGVDSFELDEARTLELKEWAEIYFEIFGLIGEFVNGKIGDLEIVKTRENVHLGGMHVYFFQKEFNLYGIICGSEEFIHYIITNGRW